jgi:hypothetical protein
MREIMRAQGVLLAVAIALCAASAPAAVSDGGGHGRPDFVPVNRLGGLTGGELVGQWWAQVLAIPAAENPLFPPSPARCLTLGRRGKVAAMAGTARSAPLTCTIKAGTPLFVAAGLSECSSAEPEPYKAVTKAEQRRCAIEFFSSPVVVATFLSLDGGRPVDIHTERFQLVSPQTRVVFPQGAIFDAKAGRATFVGAAYAATMRGRLSPGRHTLKIEFVRADGTLSTTTRTLEVVRGHGHG